jgi:hypothetical protein
MIKLFFTVDLKYNWNCQNQKVDLLEDHLSYLRETSPVPPAKKGNWNRTRHPVTIPIFKLSLLNQSGTGPIHGRQLGLQLPVPTLGKRFRIFKNIYIYK